MPFKTEWYQKANHIIHQFEEYAEGGYAPSIEFPSPVLDSLKPQYEKGKGGVSHFVSGHDSACQSPLMSQ